MTNASVRMRIPLAHLKYSIRVGEGDSDEAGIWAGLDNTFTIRLGQYD